MSAPIAAAIRSTRSGSKVARPGERGRVDRGAVGGEAGQALLVHQRRDAEPEAASTRAAGAPAPRRPRRGSPGRCRRPGSGAPARAGWPRPGDRAGRREHVLHGGDVVGAPSSSRSVRCVLVGCDRSVRHPRHVVADPAAAELGDLLLQRHRREQRLDPLGDREVGCAASDAGRRRGPAPCSSPSSLLLGAAAAAEPRNFRAAARRFVLTIA